MSPGPAGRSGGRTKPQPDQTRRLAWRVLQSICLKEAPLEQSLASTLAETSLDRRDAALVRELVYGVCRWQGRLDHILAGLVNRPLTKLDPKALILLRLAAHQIIHLDRIPDRAAVHSAVELAKGGLPGWAPGFINGVLRALIRLEGRFDWPDRSQDPAGYLAARQSFPRWLVELFLNRFGEETKELLQALNRTPELCLRVNSLTGTRAELLAELTAAGFQARPGRFSPWAVACPGSSVEELTAARPGRFTAQAEASQLVAAALAPPVGGRVLDLCAGAGGKTGHLAELMGGRGSLVALDPDAERLNTARRRLSGYQSPNMELTFIQADGRDKLPQGLAKEPFDAVLIDAPCTGLGVLSARPDRRWRVRPQDPERLSELQLELALAGAERLKKGGALVYATCTLTEPENQGLVTRLLQAESGLVPEGLKAVLPESARPLVNDQGFVVTLPHRHGLDGFFMARFIKN